MNMVALKSNTRSSVAVTQRLGRWSGPRVRTEYRFENPGRAILATRYPEEARSVDTLGDLWEHPYFGRMDWQKVRVPKPLKQAMQHYIFHELETRPPMSAFARFGRLLVIQRAIDPKAAFPLLRERIFKVFAALGKAEFEEFRRFFRWAVAQGIPGFERPTLIEVERLRSPLKHRRIDPREPGRYLQDDEQLLLIKALESPPSADDPQLRDHVLTQLCWEIGCRPEQLRGVDERHVHLERLAGDDYAYIEIPRVKQRTPAVEYKRRAISSALADKILLLITQNRALFGASTPASPLFRTHRRINARTKHYGKRLRHDTVARGIADFMSHVVPSRGYRGARMLRHNMAQRMADIGAPAAVVAEALDHSDLSSVGVYVRAKPDIAELKARALGQSTVYRDVLDWLNGREPVPREHVDPARVVQGLVADRYIGGIGACDLPKDRRCPKNPVYACYGCREFTPFIDGEHAAVAEAMVEENRRLLDVAGVEGNRVALANEYPIAVAQAVQALCAKKQGHRP